MIYKIISVAVLTAVMCLYLKNIGSDFFLPTLICGGLTITLFSIDAIKDTFSFFNTITNYGISVETVGLCLKICSIAYLVEFACGIIEDAGIKSLADKLAMAGRLIILGISLPVFNSFIKLIVSFLEGV